MSSVSLRGYPRMLLSLCWSESFVIAALVGSCPPHYWHSRVAPRSLQGPRGELTSEQCPIKVVNKFPLRRRRDSGPLLHRNSEAPRRND